MAGKNTRLIIELNDGIGVIDGLEAILNAMKDLDTHGEMAGGNVIEWDLSKNVPGFNIKMRDECVGVPMKYIVWKAKRTRKSPTPVSEVQ